MQQENIFKELSREVHCRLSLDGFFLSISENSTLVFTYKEEELIGKNILQYISTEEFKVKFQKEILESTAEGEVFSFPFNGRSNNVRWLKGQFKKLSTENNEFYIAMVLHDSTYKMQIKQRAEENEERYMLLLNTSNDGIVFHVNGIIVDANETIEKLLGFSIPELIGKSIYDLIEDKDWKKINDRIKSGLEYSDEFYIIRKDGKRNPFLITTKKHIQKNRSVRAVFFKDLSEVKSAKAKLLESEEKYKNLVESGQELIYTSDFNGNFTYVNPVGLAKIEYSEEEIVSMSFLDLIREDWKGKVGEFYNKQFINRESDSYFEFPVITKSGSEFWLGQHAHMIMHDNRVIGFQVYARDITERKIAEDKLKAQIELTDSIFDNLPISIFIKDKEGRIHFANKYSLGFFGVTREDAFLKKDYEIVPDDIIKVARKCEKIAWEEGEYHSEEKIYIDGNPYVILLGKIRLYNNGIPFMMSYTIDITKRKQAEVALLEAKKQLEDSVQSKERFISIMSHEIRTPMNAVIGITNLLLQQATQENNEYLNALKVSSENLLKILNNVLDLTKIESGKIDIERIDFNLKQSISVVKELYNLPAAEKNIVISVSIDPSIPEYVKGDPYRLNQILINLVSNAIKFTEEGRIEIKVSLSKLSNKEIRVNFQIEDTGIGISRDKFSHIFESFTQEDINVTRKYGGTGLGLTITRKLVELMGGTINVESEKGSGAKFFFDLIFQHSSDGSNKINEPLTEITGLDGLQALVVDDNKMNQLIVRKFLERKNVAVFLAENGKEAIEYLKQDIKFDIILMDLLMPEMDGYETANFIRNELKMKDLPIIAFTASSEAEIEKKVFVSGMNDFIVKPFEPNHFYNVIAKYTGRSKHDFNFNIMATTVKITSLSYLKDASNGNMEFVKEMIQIFIKQTPIYLSELTRLTQENNWNDFKAVIHKLKPTITMMGIKEGEELVRSMEVAAKSLKETDKIPTSMARLQVLCNQAFEELSQELN